MATAKTSIIRTLFFDPQRERRTDGSVGSPIVTLDEVRDAIGVQNATNAKKLSDKNPANFFKDFIRNGKSANEHWPREVFEAGYTARQVTGEGACFKFVPVPDTQTVPFRIIRPNAEAPLHRVESVSLPLASRVLGRGDEPWLIQVVVKLRIVEMHFALVSERKIHQLDLLQLNVKLSKTEIDALYLAQEEISKDNYEGVIVTCEAKGKSDDILEEQIFQQAVAPFSMSVIRQDRVIPIAIKTVGRSKVAVIEFNEFKRGSYDEDAPLVRVRESRFEIDPPVPGIGE